jgi:type I restriction enzyme M protein
VKPKQAEPVQGEIELQEGMEHYVATPKELDEYVLDGHDHLIVKHDLYNSDGMPR